MSMPVGMVLVFMVFFGSYLLGWLLLMMVLPPGGVAWLGNLLARPHPSAARRPPGPARTPRPPGFLLH